MVSQYSQEHNGKGLKMGESEKGNASKGLSGMADDVDDLQKKIAAAVREFEQKTGMAFMVGGIKILRTTDPGVWSAGTAFDSQISIVVNFKALKK